MRGRQLILLLAIVSSLAGCGTPASPTSTPIIVQPTSRPSSTAPVGPEEAVEELFTPVPTSLPTLYPASELRTKGPYFAYYRVGDEGYQLVLRDADGKGLKAINLPEAIVNAYPDQPYDTNVNFVSPDGRWLAFYTGFAGDMWDITGSGAYDLTLNLLDLTSGETKVVTPLLSKDYPDNFTRAAEELKDPEITAESLQQAFLNGIRNSLAWSPDGGHLAFAGQMDGLSSDLYVYDLGSEKIRRLSSGDQELQWINWSPDGKWILHSGAFWMGMGVTFDVYAAAVDGSSVRYLSANSFYYGIENWLNPHTYFENDSENGPGNYGLRLVDVETGKITKLWDGSYFFYASNEAGNLVVVNAYSSDRSPYQDPGEDTSFVAGPYLIDLTTLQKTKIEIPSDEDPINYTVSPFGLNGQEFVLMGGDSSLYFLSATSALTPFDLKGAQIAVSPDSNSWAAVMEEMVNIYSGENTLVHSLPLSLPVHGANSFTWNPDSSGLFIVYESSLYFVDISNGQVTLMEKNLANSYSRPAYLWVNSE